MHFACVAIDPNYFENQQLLRELFTVAIGGALRLAMFTLYVDRYPPPS